MKAGLSLSICLRTASSLPLILASTSAWLPVRFRSGVAPATDQYEMATPPTDGCDASSAVRRRPSSAAAGLSTLPSLAVTSRTMFGVAIQVLKKSAPRLISNSTRKKK